VLCRLVRASANGCGDARRAGSSGIATIRRGYLMRL
jgi:hypothetical protein